MLGDLEVLFDLLLDLDRLLERDLDRLLETDLDLGESGEFEPDF